MPRISVMYCSILRTKQGHARFALLVLPLLAWCTLCAPSQQQPEHIQRWFDNLDSDRDGQLQQQELRHFVGANLGPTDYNTQIKLDAAVEQITDKLDGSDSGLDISVTELDQYLHRILKVWHHASTAHVADGSLYVPWAKACKQQCVDFWIQVSKTLSQMYAVLYVAVLQHSISVNLSGGQDPPPQQTQYTVHSRVERGSLSTGYH